MRDKNFLLSDVLSNFKGESLNHGYTLHERHLRQFITLTLLYYLIRLKRRETRKDSL